MAAAAVLLVTSCATNANGLTVDNLRPSEPSTALRAAPPVVARTSISGPASVAAVTGSLSLSGTVEGLGDRTLWLIATPEVGGGYYVVETSPVAQADGDWTFLDSMIGSSEDVGHSYTYKAYAADAACGESLKKAVSGEPYAGFSEQLCGRSIGVYKVRMTKN